MPKVVFGEKYYPNYTDGSAYLISGFRILQMLKGIDSYQGYIMSMEDVFLTGVIAERVGINRFKSELIGNRHCKQRCTLQTMAIIFSCLSSKQMRQRWLEMKNSQKLCLSENKNTSGARTKIINDQDTRSYRLSYGSNSKFYKIGDFDTVSPDLPKWWRKDRHIFN